MNEDGWSSACTAERSGEASLALEHAPKTQSLLCLRDDSVQPFRSPAAAAAKAPDGRRRAQTARRRRARSTPEDAAAHRAIYDDAQGEGQDAHGRAQGRARRRRQGPRGHGGARPVPARRGSPRCSSRCSATSSAGAPQPLLSAGARHRASPAPSSSSSSIPATGSRSSGSGRSASSTATGAAASATTRGPARCWTRRCRSPPSARAASRGSTCSRSTARRRRGSARSPRAPACRRWRARPRGSAARPTSSRSPLRGLGIFQTPPPAGVRVADGDGAHYLQYSGLREAEDPQRLRPVARRPLRLRRADRRRDRALAVRRRRPRRAQGGADVRHRRLVAVLARLELTRESDLGYHKLLRDFLVQLCTRTATVQYCSADQHFTSYLTHAAGVEVLARTLRPNKTGKLRFKLSKISRCRVRVTRGDDGGGDAQPGRARPRDQDAGLDGAEEDRRLHRDGHRHRPGRQHGHRGRRGDSQEARP